MSIRQKTTARERELQRKLQELELRLMESEETLRAIREGEVDAVVVTGSRGQQVFSLVGTESIYRLIVETMKEAAFTVTFDGRILFCNAQFGEMVQCPLERVVGRSVDDFIAPADRAAAASLLAAAQKSPARQRLKFRTGDGQLVPAHVAANVLHQPDHMSICIVASDLTELENSTELIARLRRQQETLRKTAAELKRSNSELEQFAYVASHDLQEPLRIVSSFLKLLKERYDDRLDDRGRQYIDFAVDGAHRMLQLIRDLLEFSRTHSRRPHLRPVCVNEALDKAVANLRESIDQAGATITRGELPKVFADPTQLMQLLQNLVGNAVKFRHPQRPCKIHVSANRTDGTWQISVSDNGIGIDPKQHDRIFVIFQRLHTREQYAGTGIGLALCKKIVERHGGRIWVESQIDKGSTFHFTFPQAPQDPGDECK
jgi:PAS domain S-box-containing protein